jgi:hypothetical protein
VQLTTCWIHNETKTIHVSAIYEGRILNAWGADSNESLALSKALVELTERIHLRTTPFTWHNALSNKALTQDEVLLAWPILTAFMQTSSGMAAHYNHKNAKQNALHEIIERHVITKAMLEGVAPKKIDSDSFNWNGPFQTNVALVRHQTKEQGSYLFGTAASFNSKEALAIAARELSALIPWSQNSANISHLLKVATPNRPSEIQAYHIEQKRQIEIFETSNAEQQIISSHITLEDVWFADIPLLKSFEKTGIKIVRAFSPLMQPLYFGKLSDGPINPAAIDLSRLNIQAEYNVVA